MNMHMPRQPGAGSPAQINAEVDPVRLQFLLDFSDDLIVKKH